MSFGNLTMMQGYQWRRNVSSWVCDKRAVLWCVELR